MEHKFQDISEGNEKRPTPKRRALPVGDLEPLDQWDELINGRIEEAMKAGAFDNLPGKGKPLRLNENPNEPSDMQMAHKILKNNDLTPPWIADRKAILAEIETIRGEMRRRWDQSQGEPDGAAEWQQVIPRWETRIADLNRRIRDLNLGMPIPSMEILRLRLDDELARIGATRTITR
jgi:DnaJ homolog subfamily C member 28